MRNKLTVKKIESLGFKILDIDKETKKEYTFEKIQSQSPKHYSFLTWRPETGEVILSETRIQNTMGSFKIKKTYQGIPKTFNELKEILK